MDGLLAVLVAVLMILGIGALVGGQQQVILSTVSPPVSNTADRQVSRILDPEGRGAMHQAIEIVDGLYGFRWFASAGEVGCAFGLVLEGPDAPIVLDDGRINGRQSASAMSLDVRLETGSYVLVADTDCPGDARLWAWRYID